MITLAELTEQPIKLYAKLYYKGIKPIAKKEVYREVEYYRVKKKLTKKKKFLVNLYKKEDIEKLMGVTIWSMKKTQHT